MDGCGAKAYSTRDAEALVSDAADAVALCVFAVDGALYGTGTMLEDGRDVDASRVYCGVLSILTKAWRDLESALDELADS